MDMMIKKPLKVFSTLGNINNLKGCFWKQGTPQPLYNTIVGVHSINHVS